MIPQPSPEKQTAETKSCMVHFFLTLLKYNAHLLGMNMFHPNLDGLCKEHSDMVKKTRQENHVYMQACRIIEEVKDKQTPKVETLAFTNFFHRYTNSTYDDNFENIKEAIIDYAAPPMPKAEKKDMHASVAIGWKVDGDKKLILFQDGRGAEFGKDGLIYIAHNDRRMAQEAYFIQKLNFREEKDEPKSKRSKLCC